MENPIKEDDKIDLISTSGVYKTPFSLIILLQVFFGGLILVSVNIWFLNSLYYLLTGMEFYSLNSIHHWSFWLLVPLNIYGNIFLFFISVVFFAVLIHKILLKLHPIQEGIFSRDSRDWKYFHRRFWNAYFPIWLARATPFPWMDIVVYSLFGTKIGSSVVAYEGYIDPELIEIGDNTMTSLNICIFSHLIYHERILIRKVKIGKNCIIGPQTLTSPGTIIEDGAILGANSYTRIGQRLAENLIHVGTPVNMTFPIQSVDESRKKAETLKKKVFLDENTEKKNFKK